MTNKIMTTTTTTTMMMMMMTKWLSSFHSDGNWRWRRETPTTTRSSGPMQYRISSKDEVCAQLGVRSIPIAEKVPRCPVWRY